MWNADSIRSHLRKVVGTVGDRVSAKSLFDRQYQRIRRQPVIAAVERGRLPTVIAIGKMANAMSWEFSKAFNVVNVRGVVSSPYESSVPKVAGLEYYQGGHPLPNDQSITAAKRALDLLATGHPQDPVVYLISGGGSACFELPVPELCLEDLRQTYQALISCGADIREVNSARQRMSQVKGGQLVLAAKSLNQLAMIVSDVPGNGLSYVSSGPVTFVRESVNVEQVMNKYSLRKFLPTIAFDLLLERSDCASDSDSEHEDVCDSICVGSNDDAIDCAVKLCHGFGWQVRTERGYDEADVGDAAIGLLSVLNKMSGPKPCCVVAGGEVSSKVTGDGEGGRNQAFVLNCVPLISGQNVVAMSFGTDGIDGNSPAAGAIADGETSARGTVLGMSYQEFVAESNSHAYFSKLGDTIDTGPTGNNVCDLRMLVKF